jgi:hypothetical protein
MGRSLTNNFILQYARETTFGVIPTSGWKTLEPNAITTFGANITTVERSPISQYKQRRKGAITDLDSSAEFDADMTIEHFDDFIEGFCFSNFVGPLAVVPTSVTAPSTYNVPTITPLVANDLIYVRGFVNAANNGLKVVASSTANTIVITDADLITETAPTNALIEVAGVRTAAGDLDINIDGNITSGVLDFTTLDLTVGQGIWVGGDAALNRFTAVNNAGFCRIVSIDANLLIIDKTSFDFAEEVNTTQEVDLYFGRFVRNRPVDDADYQEISFTIEGAFDNLSETSPGNPSYEYARGNYCNTLGWDMPLTDKATFTASFIGLDTDVPTDTRATGADTPVLPLQTSPFNTSTDFARLRVQNADQTGLTTDFKSLTLTINNNVSPEKVLGLIGSKYINTGNFEIDMETQLVFTDPAVVAAIRNNETVTMDFAVTNDNGAILIDVPSMTLGAGDKEFPVNESILINITAQAFGDPILNTSIGVSKFPYKPDFEPSTP